MQTPDYTCTWDFAYNEFKEADFTPLKWADENAWVLISDDTEAEPCTVFVMSKLMPDTPEFEKCVVKRLPLLLHFDE